MHNNAKYTQGFGTLVRKTMKTGYLERVANQCKAMLSFNHEVLLDLLGVPTRFDLEFALVPTPS